MSWTLNFTFAASAATIWIALSKLLMTPAFPCHVPPLTVTLSVLEP